jgi:hypothetical protein
LIDPEKYVMLQALIAEIPLFQSDTRSSWFRGNGRSGAAFPHVCHRGLSLLEMDVLFIDLHRYNVERRKAMMRSDEILDFLKQHK